LYLRPEPQWHGSLRPGRAIVVAVIERVYCNPMYSTEDHIAVITYPADRAILNAGDHKHFASCNRFANDSDALMGSDT
jgi:hypothetical protein